MWAALPSQLCDSALANSGFQKGCRGLESQGSRGLHVEAHRHKGDPQASRSHGAGGLVALGGGFR